jgi:hypothetical protein
MSNHVVCYFGIDYLHVLLQLLMEWMFCSKKLWCCSEAVHRIYSELYTLVLALLANLDKLFALLNCSEQLYRYCLMSKI